MTLNSIAGTDADNNFSPGAFIGNISGAVGGYFGSYLAAKIVPATGIASSIGGRIGGAIGGFLASEIPVVGTFFGSLVGSVLGTLVGSLFDPHVVPWSSEMVGAVNGVLGINYWNWNSTGNPQEFTNLSNMVAGNANQVLALTRRDPNIMNITGLTSLNELVFNQWRSAEMNKGLTLACSRCGSTWRRMSSRVTPLYNRRRRSRRRENAGVWRCAGELQPIGVNAPHTRLIHRQERRSACG
jgi:hypothetical protein